MMYIFLCNYFLPQTFPCRRKNEEEGHGQEVGHLEGVGDILEVDPQA